MNNEPRFSREGHALFNDVIVSDILFSNLRVSQTISAMLPFKTFMTHSLVQLTSSFSQFHMIGLRNFGKSDLSM